MAAPTTNNQLAGLVNSVLKDLIEGAGVAEVVAACVAAYPFLGWPVISWLFSQVVMFVADKIYAQAAMIATKIVIDIQVNLEESSVTNTFQSLQMAIASGDQSAITKASADLSASYASLIHADGWSPP
jgi:hypothetical protein